VPGPHLLDAGSSLVAIVSVEPRRGHTDGASLRSGADVFARRSAPGTGLRMAGVGAVVALRMLMVLGAWPLRMLMVLGLLALRMLGEPRRRPCPAASPTALVPASRRPRRHRGLPARSASTSTRRRARRPALRQRQRPSVEGAGGRGPTERLGSGEHPLRDPRRGDEDGEDQHARIARRG